MLRNLAQLEAKITSVIGDQSIEKTFHFLCDQDSPLPAVKDALVKFMAYVSQLEEQVKAQQEAAKKAQDEAKQSSDIEKVESIVTSEG